MALYLVQHGKCLPKEVDPRRPLTDQGADDVKRIAEVARGYGVRVATMGHSGKARAKQTAELIAKALGVTGAITQLEGIGPLDDASAFARGINPEDNRMIVGHLPFLERLTSWLVSGRAEPPVFRFQNGGIVCLDYFDDTQAWAIKWTLMPKIG